MIKSILLNDLQNEKSLLKNKLFFISQLLDKIEIKANKINFINDVIHNNIYLDLVEYEYLLNIQISNINKQIKTLKNQI